MGYGRGADNGETAWTTPQEGAINDCVRSGLRQFYFPPPLEGESGPYDWSFLKPVASLSLASGASTLALPDDFGGLEGQLTVSASGGYLPVPIVNEGTVRAEHALKSGATGRPMMAALKPLKPTGKDKGQRFELYIYPEADQAYTLEVSYYVLADYLSTGFPHHLGGMAHGETIMGSCLAIAEQRFDDSSTVHSFKFRERLAASIGLDRRNKAQLMGYNRDRSDGYDSNYMRDLRHGWRTHTVNGVAY